MDYEELAATFLADYRDVHGLDTPEDGDKEAVEVLAYLLAKTYVTGENVGRIAALVAGEEDEDEDEDEEEDEDAGTAN